MTLKLTTESGGVYEIDEECGYYRKAVSTPESYVGETPWARFTTLAARVFDDALGPYGQAPFEPTTPEEITVGQQLYFSNRDYWLYTSPVVSIERIAQ